MAYFYLTVAIIAEVTATLALKASDGFTRPLPAVVVVAGYAIAFVLLSFTLRTIPVGIAYAIWAGAGIALVLLAGAVMFGQKPDAAAMIGIALIVGGIAVINLGSQTAMH